jgi:hypothetical protein
VLHRRRDRLIDEETVCSLSMQITKSIETRTVFATAALVALCLSVPSLSGCRVITLMAATPQGP